MPNIGFNQIGGSPRDRARTRYALQRLKEVQATGDTVPVTANGGLNNTADGLAIKLNGGTLTLSASGLAVTDATSAQRGSVLRQTLVTDAAVLTDNSGGTAGSGTIAAVSVTITDPADTPVDADALRDDLVANTLPSIGTSLSDLRNAVATLAEYATSLEDKINAMLAAQKTAGQMNTA